MVAVEHLDGAGGGVAGVLGDLDLGEAALADGLAELVRPHPRRPPRPPARRRHPSFLGGGTVVADELINQINGSMDG